MNLMCWRILIISLVICAASTAAADAVDNDDNNNSNNNASVLEPITKTVGNVATAAPTTKATAEATAEPTAESTVKATAEVTAAVAVQNDEMSITNKNVKIDNKPQMEVMELQLNDAEMQQIMSLHAAIAAESEKNQNAVTHTLRNARNIEDNKLKAEADALTDAEITEIVKMISFPSDEIIEDQYPSTHTKNTATAADIEPRIVEREPRARRNHGYYILAFSPLEGPVVPYTKLDIIPVERSANADLDMSASDLEETRMLSRRKLNYYIRRMMKQIRKGTRMIQRKTRFKSAQQEPTVENFLHSMYQQRQKQLAQKQRNKWFSW